MARITLKAVNDELVRRGHHARLEKASGYFYFWSADSAGWIDRTVRVERLNSLTLDPGVGEYHCPKKVNAEKRPPCGLHRRSGASCAVGRVGLEPTTNGLKVHCSAN